MEMIRTNHGRIAQDDLPGSAGYVDHKRGKNWIATLHRNGRKLDRDFWPHASKAGEYYVPEMLAIGDIIEVAGDYENSRGRRDRNRDYLVIESVNGAEFDISDPFGTLDEAFDYREDFNAQVAVHSSVEELAIALNIPTPRLQRALAEKGLILAKGKDNG